MDALLQTEIGRIAQELQLERQYVEGAIELLLSGASVSQIHRYRKLQTGAISEDAIRFIARRLHHVRHLYEKRDLVRKLAESKEKSTEALGKSIEEATTSIRLDDLAMSLRPRKASFAQAARDAGLEQLAEAIFEQSDTVGDLQETLAAVVDPEKHLATVEDVQAGVQSILAEMIFEQADARSWGREVIRAGRLHSSFRHPMQGQSPSGEGNEGGGRGPEGGDPRNEGPGHRRGPQQADFRAFAKFSEPLHEIQDAKVLGVNRGERMGILQVWVEFDGASFAGAVRHAIDIENHRHRAVLEASLPMALDRLAADLISEVRDEITVRAEEQASSLAARTVYKILRQRGVPNERILAIDPGVKNGCRYAVLEVGGAVLEFGIVYPFAARRKRKKKKKSQILMPEIAAQQRVEGWIQSIEAEEKGAQADSSQTANATDHAADPTQGENVSHSAASPAPADTASQGNETSSPTNAIPSQADAGPASDAPPRIESPTPKPDGEHKPVLPADSFYRSTSESGDEPEQSGTGPTNGSVSLSKDEESTNQPENAQEGSHASPPDEHQAPVVGDEPINGDPLSMGMDGPSVHGVRVEDGSAGRDVFDHAVENSESESATPSDSSLEAAGEGEAGGEAGLEDGDEDEDELGEDFEDGGDAGGGLMGRTADGRAPLAPRRDRAKKVFADLAAKHHVQRIALGNGPACRDVEEMIAETIAELAPHIEYTLVAEASAAAYSSSVVAREELPELDPGIRCAVSLGRRIQDPLRELVKVDPQNWGLGAAPLEIGGRKIRERLFEAVESCVNEAGIDLNTAHPWLLQHISGLNPVRARLICDHRAQNGPFHSREQLKQVECVSEDVFSQCAGFVRVLGGAEPLDETSVHPESYDLARRVLATCGADASQLRDPAAWAEVANKLDSSNAEELAAQLSADVPTVWDILEFLARPNGPSKENLPGPVFKTGLRKLEDLVEGQEFVGAIINVVEFGAFVDIGLKDCGLVHLSQMATRFVRSPHDLATVGDIVKVWVIGLDHDRKRVSLSMLPPEVRQRQMGGGRRGDGRDSRDNRGDNRGNDGRPPRGRGRGEGGNAGGDGSQRQQSQGQGQGRGGPRRNDRQNAEGPRVYTVQPKPKPKPQVSAEAMEGKGVLRGFGELKAFFEAKKPKSGPDTPKNSPPTSESAAE